jgi:hypothetical protein
LALLNWQAASGDEDVPEWFRFDEKRPYAIFEAWKELSTRRAMICLGESWKVLGGRLVNEQGEAVPNTPIRMNLVPGKAISATLQTDNRGYFLVYSPFSLELMSGEAYDGRNVTATPDYPASQAGQAFAYKRRAIRICQITLAMREEDRAFYVLTCDDQTGFDAEEFKAFEREFLEQKSKPREPFRDRPKDPEGKPVGIVQSYDIRVLDDQERGVPDALVKYQLSGLSPGFQVRQTDTEGRCKLEEWPPPHGDRIYRILTVDAPGFGVGPVPFVPKLGVENAVRLRRPAVVEGRILDDQGNPLACQLSVHYKRLAWIAFETDFHSHTDGTFRFERVMPDEEFVVVSAGAYSGTKRWAIAQSGWLSLKPDTTSQQVEMRLALAASIRGIITTVGGSLVPLRSIASPQLDFGPREDDFPGNQTISYVGTDNGTWGPNDGRFGFSGLDGRPFRIRVNGWETDPAEPIQLEPGEMRFIRVTLKKQMK